MTHEKTPDLPLTGGCQCGKVSYRVTAPPLTFYVCHCHDCQRQSGSAFGESLQIRIDALIVSGETATFDRVAGSGRRMRCVFCPACGTRLWHVRAEGSEFAALKPGTLDDTNGLVPVAEIFTDRRQAWVQLPPLALSYAGQPDMEEMRQAFATAQT